MKIKLLPSGVHVSQKNRILVSNIKNHLTSIDDILNFEKYNLFLNPKVINNAFYFTYEKQIIFENDIYLVNSFFSYFDFYNSLSVLTISPDNFNNLINEVKLQKEFSSINDSILNFKNFYVNRDVENFFVLIIQNYKNSSFKNLNNTFLEFKYQVETYDTKSEIENYFVDFIYLESKKRKSEIISKILLTSSILFPILISLGFIILILILII